MKVILLKKRFWNNLASAQRRVDRYAANGDVAATSISQGELVSVKVAGGFGPILMGAFTTYMATT